MTFDKTIQSDLSDLKGLFVVWGPLQGSRRSEQIAKKFKIDIEYIYLTRKTGLLYAPFKYAYQAVATLSLLFQRRPDLVFIQNPPIFGALFVYFYCLFFGAQFVIDTHTGALLYPQWQPTIPLQQFLARRALATIVTNKYLAEKIASWNASIFVLEDPPMTLPHNGLKVVMVSVAYPDEPVAEMVEVARHLPEMTFYITGDFSKSRYFAETVRTAPANVHFTGFLREGYFALLAAADVIVCLTKDDYTFQSGANEALWLGKPLITSDWPVLRDYFNKGTLHVDNSVEGIEQALGEMAENLAAFQADMAILQQECRAQWSEKAQALLALIQQNERLQLA